MNMRIISTEEVKGMNFGSDVGTNTHTEAFTLSLASLVGVFLSESLPMCAGKQHSCRRVRL